MVATKVTQLIWILGIIAQAQGTQYKTRITRNNDETTNQKAVSDHVVIEKCSGMNCTEACRKDCNPNESMWWLHDKPDCIKDDHLIKNIEGICLKNVYQGCLFNSN